MSLIKHSYACSSSLFLNHEIFYVTNIAIRVISSSHSLATFEAAASLYLE
jgi:hypothetical protein